MFAIDYAYLSTGALAVLVLSIAASRGVLGGSARQLRSAYWFAARTGLPLKDVEPELVRQVLRRNRFALAGALAGTLASGRIWTGLWPVLVFAGFALGAVAGRLTVLGPPPDSPRVAHATDTRVADHVPPWLLAVLYVAAALPVTLTLLLLTLPQRGDALVILGGRATVLLLVLPPTALIGSLLLARVVVRRRRAVTSVAELAVDDALRAQAVRDCLHLSAATSLATLYAVSIALRGLSADDHARSIGGWAPVLAVGGLVLVALAFELTGGPLRWRRLHDEQEVA